MTKVANRSRQTELPPYTNQGLFSNNYIKHRLPKVPIWRDCEPVLSEIAKGLKTAFRAASDANLGPGEESKLEEILIRPVLRLLGLSFDVQPKSTRGKRPDYALFISEEDYLVARRHKASLQKFYGRAAAVLEAKYWGRRLNDADPKDRFDQRDPTAQTARYLDDAYHLSDGRVQWAILTNGKLWRLFYYRSGFRAGTYYEVDLETVVQRGTPDDLKLFYLFFSSTAFEPDTQTGETLLERYLKGSQDYASEISDKLKDLIFDQVFEGLAQGFVDYRRSALDKTEETEADLKEMFDGCMTLLYRLLFLLYAESRNLLPVEEFHGYRKKSLTQLREDVAHELATEPLEQLSRHATDYWDRFSSLCNIIAKGDPALNVPMYNGGLFEPKQDDFLTRHKLADYFFAQALHLLTAVTAKSKDSSPKFYDYSSLGVRHLGDIYEGLLEFHIRVADEPMAAVKEKGKLVWVTADKTDSAKATGTKNPGDVYIENSKHERKATGSYFTPHYIVEYIVKHAVGPVLEERLKRADVLLGQLQKLYSRQRRKLGVPKDWRHWDHPSEPRSDLMEDYWDKTTAKRAPGIASLETDLFETIFDLNVLDPAMGSGHFLVHAVDFISDRLITFLAKHPENPVIARINGMRKQIVQDVVKRQGVKLDQSRLTEVNLIKRMVMKRCIYGVDLNPMAVELAKLSLWLDSFTLGAPLSFLDHHLKSGNSLVGVDDVSRVVLGAGRRVQFEDALSLATAIARSPDSTMAEVEKSRSDADSMRVLLDPLKRRVDFTLTKDAGFAVLKSKAYDHIESAIQAGTVSKLSPQAQADVAAASAAAKKHGFFHWRLEFPEVFYTEKGEHSSPGFDAVVGNPPYGLVNKRQNKGEGIVVSDEEFAFYKRTPAYAAAQGGMLNVYRLFVIKGVGLLRAGGLFSEIFPLAFIGDSSAASLRRYILEQSQVDFIEAFPERDDPNLRVFETAKMSVCITQVRAQTPHPQQFYVRVHRGRRIDTSSEKTKVVLNDIRLIDNRYLTIPLVNSAELALLVKVFQGALRVEDIGHCNTGEVDLTLGKPYISRDHSDVPLLRGAVIDRYTVHRSMSQGEFLFLRAEKYLAEVGGNKTAHHGSERIVLQGITGVNERVRLKMTLVPKGVFCANSVNYITLHTSKVDTRFLLGVLNSRLLNFVFSKLSTNSNVNGYEVDNLPVPNVKKKARFGKQHDGVVRLVENMLDMHRRLQEQKTVEACRELVSEIADTDKQIDALVYKLYGLTEDEIAIVEGRKK